MKCSVCSADSDYYLSAKILGKYDVSYYKCSLCEFIQTESPYWLKEAYDAAITKLDIGLITRNELMVPVVRTVVSKWFDPNGRFVDYGGGYGMLVRMMRDRGFDYYRQDIYCDNLYAESFDIKDVEPFKANLLTAFEVFEHLTDPVVELEKMLTFSDAILFSTEVQPFIDATPTSWWYFIPETGQHVSLYSRKSLQVLADRFNLYYNWNEQNIHLYSRKKINNVLFKAITNPDWMKWYIKTIKGRTSLLNKDFMYIRDHLRGNL